MVHSGSNSPERSSYLIAEFTPTSAIHCIQILICPLADMEIEFSWKPLLVHLSLTFPRQVPVATLDRCLQHGLLKGI
jgi:hypothetical protein